MTAPKVFGREMGEKRWKYDETKERRVRVGILTLFIEYHREEYPDTPYSSITGGIEIAGRTVESQIGVYHQSEANAIAWLESTARRIMRECFEIAGEMVATGPTPQLVVDGVKLPSIRIPGLDDAYEVRFNDD